MAEEEQDTSQKTEEPTEHRIQQALEQGQMPISRELNGWAVILGMWILIGLVIPFSGSLFFKKLAFFLEHNHLVTFEISEVYALTQALGIPFMMTLCAWVGLPFICVLLMGGIQTQGRVSLAPLMPKWSRLSPAQGLKKILGLNAWFEFFKTCLKFLCVAILCSWLLYAQAPQYVALMHLPLAGMAGMIHRHMNILVMAVVMVTGLMAVLDVFYQRFQWRKNLKMSTQELRDEYKQTEGDPVIKGRFKALRQERARKRMIAAVPQATVVVVNPTHYAVALRYDAEAMDAPRVIAKGVDFLALTIREVAQKHTIPIVQDAPLARLLYQDVPLDHIIPEQHYQAVARLIRWVMNLNKHS